MDPGVDVSHFNLSNKKTLSQFTDRFRFSVQAEVLYRTSWEAVDDYIRIKKRIGEAEEEMKRESNRIQPQQ